MHKLRRGRPFSIQPEPFIPPETPGRGGYDGLVANFGTGSRLSDARPSGLLTLTQRVSLVIQLFFVLIASNETEADRISTALDHGRGYVCTDTAQLAATFERIFQASVAPIE